MSLEILQYKYINSEASSRKEDGRYDRVRSVMKYLVRRQRGDVNVQVVHKERHLPSHLREVGVEEYLPLSTKLADLLQWLHYTDLVIDSHHLHAIKDIKTTGVNLSHKILSINMHEPRRAECPGASLA